MMLYGKHKQSLSLTQWLIRDALALLNLSGISCGCQWVAWIWQCLDVFSVMLIRLQLSVCNPLSFRQGNSYEWHAAVCAPVDLWLIEVDEDSWMTQWASSTIA